MDFMKLDIQLFSYYDGDVEVKVVADTKEFKKGLNDIQNTTKNAGGTIKNIVAGLGITKLISTAMGQITSSIDGAISRYDILNNFPNVMKNLGIATEDSQKAIDKMADKLSGLPTTLDEGALAVQRFTSKNNDVGKSTDLFLALNNALLAGGASSVIQSTALEQLAQAYAKGKPDMVEWKSAMTAMPAQLKQVATAMGYVDADALGEALRNGEVSMDDFMNTMMQLNEKGVDGFASFEEQARNSTGGIKTSITVAKTQVVKGVTDIIDGLNKGLADANLPSLGEIIASVGKKAKEGLDVIAKNLPSIIKAIAPFAKTTKEVLKTLASYLPKVFEFIKKMAPALVPIIAAIGAFQTVSKIIGIIKGVAGAISVLNGVLLANPIGLVVAAIAGLVAGFVILWKKSEAFREFWINLWNGLKEFLKPIIDAMVGMFKSAWDLIKVVWDLVKPYFEMVFSQIKIIFETWKKVAITVFKTAWEIIKGVWNVVGEYFKTLFNVISGIFSAIKNVLTGNFKGAWQNIKGVFSNVGSFFGTVRQAIFNAFKNIGSGFLSIGRDIIQGIWKGISGSMSWIKGRISDWCGSVVNWFKKKLKIDSPSKVMRDEIGVYMAQGVGVGFTDELSSIYADMQKAINFENAKLQGSVEMGKVFNMINSSTPVTIALDASVEMDNQKVGRLVAPSVMQSVKTRGGY